MASRQISYCSVEEAWGDNRPKFKPQDLLLEENENWILNDREISRSGMKPQYTQNENDKMNKTSEHMTNSAFPMSFCHKFYEHFLECDECREKIERFLSKKRNDENDNQSSGLIEGFFGGKTTKNESEGYMDIFILILVGIFLIFILDCFVRLGRMRRN